MVHNSMLLIIIIRTELINILPQRLCILNTCSFAASQSDVSRSLLLWPILSMTLPAVLSWMIPCYWIAKRNFRIQPFRSWTNESFPLSTCHSFLGVVREFNRTLWELTLGIGPSGFLFFSACLDLLLLHPSEQTIYSFQASSTKIIKYLLFWQLWHSSISPEELLLQELSFHFNIAALRSTEINLSRILQDWNIRI